MAKQTFTTGQVLTAAQMTALQQTAMLGGDANARTASYVLVAGDAGNAITMSSTSATTITVNTGIFAAGDIVTIVNINTGVCTITAGTATVTTSGSLALAANQGGVLRFTSASAAIFLQFATPASGDIEGITTGANSGLTGGVTSGTADLKLNFTAKGQLAVGTGSGTTGFLTVGSNGQYIVADSAQTTGIKWAAASSGGFVLITSNTFSNVSSVTIDNCFTSTYDTYLVTFVDCYGATAADDAQIQWRYGGSTKTSLYWGSYFYYNSGAFVTAEFSSASQATISDFVGSSSNKSNGQMFLSVAGASGQIMARGQWANADTESANNFGNVVISTETYDGLLFKSSSTNVTGTIRVYGLVKS